MVSNPLHVLAATATDGAPTTRPSTTATDSALATSFHVRRISSSPLYCGGLGACPEGLLRPARSGQALSEDSASFSAQPVEPATDAPARLGLLRTAEQLPRSRGVRHGLGLKPADVHLCRQGPAAPGSGAQVLVPCPLVVGKGRMPVALEVRIELGDELARAVRLVAVAFRAVGALDHQHPRS